MITKVDKYLIFGMKEDLDLFYQRAQEQGFIEFIKNKKKSNPLSEELHILLDAIKILKKIAVDRKKEGVFSAEEAFSLAKRTVHLRDEILYFQEEKRVLEFEIARVAPFGDFLLEDISYIEASGDRKIQFFCVRSGEQTSFLENKELVYVNSEYGLDYFISIHKQSTVYPGLIEMRIDKPLGLLEKQLRSTVESIDSLERELKSLAQKLECFHETFLTELNAYNLSSAKKEVRTPLDEASFFCAEAWIPISKKNILPSLLLGSSIEIEKIVIEEGDRVPTVMENTGVKRIGEDLVNIYDIPAATDKDPSGWVFWFFALFFAMIVADAGYGLLYLAFAGYLKLKFRSFTGAAKRFYRLFVVLSFFVIIWGVITASFFGIEIAQDNVLRKIAPIQWLAEAKAGYHLSEKDGVYEEWKKPFPSVEQAVNGKQFIEATTAKAPKKAVSPVIGEFSNNILLELSLVIGIIHISVSLLRYVNRSWSNIGWICFLIGGYLFFPSMIQATTIVNFLGFVDKATAEMVGERLIYIGIATSLVLAIIQKGLSGIKEIMRLGEVFGDVLSYVRLYALALAGAIMGATFNDMGAGIGLVGGFFIIIAGHATNMALGMMSGVIHGLRLNVIEWYHYSFDGGGCSFKPLRLFKSKED